jgi:hypothetical protein
VRFARLSGGPLGGTNTRATPIIRTMTTAIIECSFCRKRREIKGRDEQEFSRAFGQAVEAGWIPRPDRTNELMCPDCRDPKKK